MPSNIWHEQGFVAPIIQFCHPDRAMTRMHPFAAVTAALALFAPLNAEAAGSDPFCTQLQAIVADAPNGFAKFQGALTKKEASTVDSPAVMMDYFAASGAPAGAVSCDIEMQETTSTGNHYPNYACEFPIVGSNKGAAVRKLANQVAACLPGISRPIGPGLDKDSGMLDAHSSDYSVSYQFLAGPAKPTMSFSIQSERK